LRNWTRSRARSRQPQLGNARRGFVDLTPASDAAAENTRTNWSALLPGQDIPLIWEDTRDHEVPRD
jgi:hypothetical protein